MTASPPAGARPDAKVWRNVAGLVTGNVVGELLGVIVHAQMLNILGPSGFGRYAQSLAVVEISDGLASFGMNEVGPVLGVKYGLDNRALLGSYLGTLLALRLGFVVLVGGATLALVPYLQSAAFGVIALCLLMLPFSALGNTATVPFFLHQENTRIAWIPGTSALLQMGALQMVLWWAPALPWVILAVVLGRAFSAVAVSETARRRYQFRYGFSPVIARDLLGVGPRAAWLCGVVLLYTRASYLVLDSLGPVMLGIYGLADRITSPVLRVMGALSASSLPMFASLARSGERGAVWGFYVRNVWRIVGGLVALSPLFYGVVPWIVNTFFPNYADSLPVLYWLYVAVGVMSLCQLTSACLNGLGRFGWVAAVATVNLFVYALAAWLWVDRWQAVGAAVATLMMETCNLCMQIFLLLRALKQHHPQQPPTNTSTASIP